ncbi:hypothetical protein [Palleronia rufa]|uniref:hypothetical protein n=1 Tax=Palleronia rufa TaxID=1530186 RepID=UPI0039F10D66
MPLRRACFFELIGQTQLLALQLLDLRLIGPDHRCAGGIHKAIQQRVDLLFDALDLD